ncbi:hypothetical protein IBA8401_01190 [Pseudomonas syringae]|uniref:hypothetical protein n=1 Tax=Pseudomonas syringae group TaxID=136849 RepID=UPI0013CE7FC3|nr:hypothetical protein [Pseudomonas syringae group genomosp. 3]MCZ0947922.1 hypothetical protein [Pseudomonas syringae pv. tomato]
MSSEDREIQAEHRRAWDQYASAYITGRLSSGEGSTSPATVTNRAAEYAEAMLKLRQQYVG